MRKTMNSMKTTLRLKTLLILGIIFFTGTQSFSQQNCAKMTFCDPSLYGDFDYQSQTRSAVLSPGDTVRTTVVVYSEQITRILCCADPKIGTVKFKLFEPIKETERYVMKINKREEEVEVYEKDAQGKVKTDDWGEKIIAGYETIAHYDTIWGRKTVLREVEIFDSESNRTGKPYWEQKVDRSKRLIIEAIVPKGGGTGEGCVNVSVGYKLLREKKFK